jgi:putative heme-binding domain-containing protein
VKEQNAGPEADALGEVARLHGVLTKDVLATGDRARGKTLFEHTCVQCHTLWGGKANLGPDLTGLNRPDLDWVLKNVIDPTAIMGAEQQILVARLADGRVVAGMKKEDAPAHLALQNEAGLVTMPKSEITAVEETKRSTMPDGLFRRFTTAELADFLAYFQGSGPLAP